MSDNPANYTPHLVDGEVDAIAVVGSTVVLGGTFTQVQQTTTSPVVSRSYLVAFDKDTGALSTSFLPTLDGPVNTLAPAGDGLSVFVGGQFNQVNGAAASKLTRLNVNSGARVAGFNFPGANGLIRDLKFVGGRLFIGGQFTMIKTTPRTLLAEINPTTGAVLPFNVSVTGTSRTNPDGSGIGPSRIYKLDISPDGSKLVFVGNFGQVGALDRNQVAMVDISVSPAQVSDWQTNAFKPACYSVFEDYLRDIDFSPDGSYFVIGTTGGFGSGPPTLCDSVSRWATTATGSGLLPTWVDYSGGDSTYTVAVTGDAIYTGGHTRWFNNPFAADAAGPGAVDRVGISALDPSNGLPLSWNPSRTRGQGVFDMVVTPGPSGGLYVGSDTDRLGGEFHGRIGFFPTAGGKSVPQPAVAPLPVDVYEAGNTSPSATGVLYRINAGGPAVTAIDSGPDWTADDGTTNPLRNSGSNSAGFAAVSGVDASVPSTTPLSIFSDERWDPADANEMHWLLPVTAGKHIQVRLYFANGCSCTASPGQRKFNVSVDGSALLTNYDIVADVGTGRGVMKSVNITSDGTVNIDFGHVVENPLIVGIEVVDRDFVPPVGNPQDTLGKVFYDGSAATSVTPPAAGGIAWGQARGAFYTNDTLYTAMADGQLYSRTFDGTTFGPATSLNLNGLGAFASEMQSMTGLFYDSGRIYFTLKNSAALYMRYFSVESGIVGAQRFTVTGNLSDLDWTKVGGMFRAGSSLYWSNSSTGDLWRTGFAAGAPAAGTATRVSGPSVDGVDWRSRALFALPGHAPNKPPTAVASVSCHGLVCDGDGSNSIDPDGSISSYSWDFGDSTPAETGVSPHHTYSTGGTYPVTLTVTDNEGASATTAPQSVTVVKPPNQPPTAVASVSCSGLVCDGNGSNSSDPDGSISSYSWDFGDSTPAETGASPHHPYATAGTYAVTLTVTDNEGASTSSAPQSVTVAPITSPISFVAAATDTKVSTPVSFDVTIPSAVQASDVMLLAFTLNSKAGSVPAPSGWTQVSATSTSAIQSVVWRRTAQAGDPGTSVVVTPSVKAKGTLTLLDYRNVDPVSPVVASSLAAETATVATHTTPTVTNTVNGAWLVSYWADKSSLATHSWTTPAAQTSRAAFAGQGGGHISSLLTDAGPAASGTVGGVAATSGDTSQQAVMATIVLRPAS
ncbi:PKD domain-containing protein [Angustibacter sp. McL0619]|uniref:PKD domain-containing protein n=1 Tax=Angustibacter sp. McL0619 TaxID=3415676 RepID=UPI003CEC8F70